MSREKIVIKEKGACQMLGCGGDIVIVETEYIAGYGEREGRRYETKKSSPFCLKCGVIEFFASLKQESQITK